MSLGRRSTPRRKSPDRITYTRQKPKAGAAPTAEERRFMDALAQMPCVVSYLCPDAEYACAGRITLHHPSASIHGGRLPRSNQCLTPICERHHLIQHGPKESVEALSHAGFYRVYGIDLRAEGNRLWKEYNQ